MCLTARLSLHVRECRAASKGLSSDLTQVRCVLNHKLPRGTSPHFYQLCLIATTRQAHNRTLVRGKERMKLRHTTLALVLCLSLLTPLSSTVTAAHPAPVASGVSVPVVGTVPGGTINAVFNLTRFALRN